MAENYDEYSISFFLNKHIFFGILNKIEQIVEQTNKQTISIGAYQMIL